MSEYLRNITIMIVDDQDFICKLLRQIIKVLGAQEVYTFTDPEEAWDFYKSKPIDLVLADWQMGPIDGIELTKRIRTSPDSPNTFVPIIMVTAHREKHHVFGARDAGVTEYVVKPVSPKSLFSRVEAVIERPRRFVRVGDFFGPDRRRHKTEFSGEDRRGAGDSKPKVSQEAAAAERKRELGQDEINTTFNPDDAPVESSKS